MKFENAILLVLNNLKHMLSIIQLVIQNILESKEIQEVEYLEIILVLNRPRSAYEEGAVLGLCLV